jgi:WD40 repeat protein
VIFSVSYDPASQLICSTSDDRSVRLWSVDIHLSVGSNHVTQWKEAKITLLHTMYGHTARVWRNIIIDNVVISAGEVSFQHFTVASGTMKMHTLCYGGIVLPGTQNSLL